MKCLFFIFVFLFCSTQYVFAMEEIKTDNIALKGKETRKGISKNQTGVKYTEFQVFDGHEKIAWLKIFDGGCEKKHKWSKGGSTIEGYGEKSIMFALIKLGLSDT